MTSLLTRFLRFTERYTKTDMVYLFKSGFWINLGSLMISGFSFFLYLAFAHFLPKEVYGTYQYLLSVGVIVGAFTLTGMNSAVVRAVAKGNEGMVRRSVFTQLRWGFLPLLGACAAGAYYFSHGNSTLGWGLVLIGLFVPFNNALNTYGALPGGRKDFRRSFLFSLSSNLLYYPALIIAAFYSAPALGLLVVNLISQAIGLTLVWYLAVRAYHPNDKTDEETIPYGKHLSLMGVFGTIAGQLDQVFAFHFLGAAPLALYSFATAVPDRLANLTKFVQSAAFPKLAVQTPAQARVTIGSRLIWALLGSALMALGYALIARLFFTLFFPTYIDAVPYSIVYAFIVIPWVSGIFIAALTAQRSIRSLYVFNGIMPVLQVVLQAAGVLVWGLWGLISARLALACIQFLLSAWLFFTDDIRMHPVGEPGVPN